MTRRIFDEPSRDEQFYARALTILVGPSRRFALILRVCNLVYWLVMLAALAWLLAQMLDREPPVLVRRADLLTSSVAAGEPIRVSYEVMRLRTCESDVSWALYDGAQEIHRFGPLHVAAAGMPGLDTFVRAWATPKNAAAGHGKIRVILAFACPGNYLQAIYPVISILPDIPVDIRAPG